MRRLAIIGALSACLLGGVPFEVMADEKTEKALEERIRRLEKLVEELIKHEAKEAKEEGKEKGKETKVGEKPSAYTFSGAGGGKSIYAKPFVSSPKATVGGYMDLQYRLFNSSNGTGPGQTSTRRGSRSFDQQRFLPFFFSAIIPSTLSEAGAGFYGTFYPTRLSKLDYELYVTQGFNGYRTNGTPVITADAGLRDARQRVSTVDDGLDNNNGKAVVGRVAFSPILGVEIGGSGYFGSYDPASKRPLSIWAAGWTFQRGPFELIGEAAWVYARDNHRTLDGTFAFDTNGRPLPRRMDGYYVQGNYHFLPQFLRRWAPSYFTEASTFTGVVRWDNINTNSELADTARQRLTLGLNFRPIEDTVFKADYQFNFEDGKNNRIRNDGLVLSVATYF